MLPMTEAMKPRLSMGQCQPGTGATKGAIDIPSWFMAVHSNRIHSRHSLPKEVTMKIERSTETHLASPQRVLNKTSKARVQTRKIRATHESERLKLVFLDAIEHDFKTPLTAIKASVTDLLDNLETDREQRAVLLTIIDEECDRMNQLLSEASEIARLESGEVKLDLASYSLGELISAALTDCRRATSNREIWLDVKHLGARLLVDLAWAKRVLVHLIANAQLYSSPGQPIRITTNKDDQFYAISVADQGPGIEEEEINHIFEKCYRGKYHQDLVEGTGMGLAIAKTIVEAHGGTIRVVSCVGQGSVFTFSLPAEC
jgi:two-component system, OmpR family, sensor histidine kinase KdpD